MNRDWVRLFPHHLSPPPRYTETNNEVQEELITVEDEQTVVEDTLLDHSVSRMDAEVEKDEPTNTGVNGKTDPNRTTHDPPDRAVDAESLLDTTRDDLEVCDHKASKQ